MKSLTLRIMAGVLLVSTAAAVISKQTDWVKTKSKEGSVTVQAPSTWYVADENDPEFKTRMEEVRKNNPELAAIMKGPAQEGQILRMLDGEDDGLDGYIDNFTIVKNVAGGLTDKMFKEVGTEILKQMPFRKEGGKKGEYKIIDTPNGKALTYWGVMDVTLPDKSSVGVDLLGYMLVKNDNLYVFTFGTKEGSLKERRKDYEKILTTAKF